MIAYTLKHLHIAFFLIMLMMSGTATIWAKGESMKQEYFKRQSRNTQQSLNRRLAAFDSLIKYSGKDWSEPMLQKSSLLMEYGKLEEALKWTDKVWTDSSQPLEYRLHAGEIKIEILFDMHRYADCFKTALEQLSTDKPDSLEYHDISAHLVLTNIFMRLDDKESTQRHLKECEDLFHSIDRKTLPPATVNDLKARILSCKAWIKLSENDLDPAFKDLKQAVSFSSKGKQRAKIINNIGFLFTIQQEYGIASDYFHEAIKESDPAHRPSYIVNYIASLSDQGQWTKVLEETDRYKKDLDALPKSGDKIKHLTALAEAYYNLGQYRAACDILMEQQELNSEVFSEEFSNNLNRQIHHYEKEKQTETDRLIHRRFIILACVSCILTLLLIGGSVMFRRTRRHSRLHKDRTEDFRKRYNQSRLEAEEKDEKLGKLNKELSTLSMKMARICSSINEIDEMASDRSVTRESLVNEIERTVKKMRNEENIWEMFRSYFEQVNQKFFDNLYRLHPDLTPAEIRMCAFILAGLSVKETATLTNRSARTVESIRYTLRKKLGITESTDAYIRHISTMSPDDCESVIRKRSLSQT